MATVTVQMSQYGYALHKLIEAFRLTPAQYTERMNAYVERQFATPGERVAFLDRAVDPMLDRATFLQVLDVLFPE